MINKKRIFFTLIVIILLAALFRLPILVNHLAEVDGDEAIFGLQAKHIITKGELPLVFWKCHFGGSLACYPTALIFLLFGISVVNLRIINILFLICNVYFAYLLGREVKDRETGLLTALILAISPPVFSIFSLCFYEYAPLLMINSLLFYLIIKTIKEERLSLYALLGVTCGVAFWLSPASLSTIIMAMVVFFLRPDKRLFLKRSFIYLSCLIIGALPFIIYNIKNPLVSIMRMGGVYFGFNRSDITITSDILPLALNSMLVKIKSFPGHLASSFYMFLDMLSLNRKKIISIPMILLYMSSIVYFVSYIIKKLKAKQILNFQSKILLIIWFVVFLFFSSTMFIAPRYFVIYYSIVALSLAVTFIRVKSYSKALSIFCLTAIVVFNVINTLPFLRPKDAGYSYANYLISDPITFTSFDIDALVSFLRSKNIKYGYANYQIAYPIIFTSNEEIIITPAYSHVLSYERNPSYTKEVDEAGDKCVIINVSEEFDFDMDKFEKRLNEKGLNYKKEKVLHSLVYYDFSERFDPKEFNIFNDWKAKRNKFI